MARTSSSSYLLAGYTKPVIEANIAAERVRHGASKVVGGRWPLVISCDLIFGAGDLEPEPDGRFTPLPFSLPEIHRQVYQPSCIKPEGARRSGLGWWTETGKTGRHVFRRGTWARLVPTQIKDA